jgi:hypothetical protein
MYLFPGATAVLNVRHLIVRVAGLSNPLCTVCCLFHTSFYLLSKRDAFACLECLGSGPRITQKLRVVFPSNVRVDKYPLLTNGASRGPRRQSPVLVLSSQDEGFDPIDRNLKSLRGAKRMDLPCEASPSPSDAAADPFPKGGSRLRNAVPGPHIDSSGSPSLSTLPRL